MKKTVLVVLLSLSLFLVGCSKENVKADYSTEKAEELLNKGEDLEGKTVEFKVDKLAPASAFGYNLQTGEHLNFVSVENPKVEEGQTVIAKIKSVKSVMGSFIIEYDLVESNKESSDSTKIETSTTKEATIEDLFDAYVSTVDKINVDNYDEDEYGYYKYSDLLRYTEGNLGLKVKIINFEVIQIIENGKYTQLLGSMPNGDIYMGLIETERLETKILTDDVLFFNSQYLNNYKYINNADVEKEVPLLYINGYNLTTK